MAKRPAKHIVKDMKPHYRRTIPELVMYFRFGAKSEDGNWDKSRIWKSKSFIAKLLGIPVKSVEMILNGKAS